MWSEMKPVGRQISTNILYRLLDLQTTWNAAVNQSEIRYQAPHTKACPNPRLCLIVKPVVPCWSAAQKTVLSVKRAHGCLRLASVTGIHRVYATFSNRLNGKFGFQDLNSSQELQEVITYQEAWPDSQFDRVNFISTQVKYKYGKNNP